MSYLITRWPHSTRKLNRCTCVVELLALPLSGTMSAENNSDAESNSFLNADKKKIFCKYWTPDVSAEDSSPRALVFICHGLGEHVQCYDDMSKKLIENGFLVFGHDHVGHGLSEGSRVNVTSFSEFTRDVIEHVEKIKLKYKDVPLFIIGHSMGGAIALTVGLEKPSLFRGMILIGPAIKPNPHTATTFKIMMVKLLARLLPEMGIAPIESKHLCRDPVVVEKYDNDPLVWHGKVKARLGLELLLAMYKLMDHLGDVTWPLLIICGTDDKLVEPEGCKMLQEKASSQDKTLKLIEGALHQVHNEPDGIGTQCLDDICRWISERC